MIATIRSEWIKLRTVRSSVVLFLAVIALTVGLSALVGGLVPFDHGEGGRGGLESPTSLIQRTLVGTLLAQFLFGVIGVLIISQEYRFSTIRVTFAAVPKRMRVYVAKFVMLAIATVVVAAITTAAAVAVGGALLSARHHPINLSTPGTWRVLIGTVLSSMVYALMGLGVGAIVRSSVGGIVIVTAWPLILENILGNIFPKVGKWFPFREGSEIFSFERTEQTFRPWIGFGYFVAVTLVVVLIGAVFMNRRDA